jgi:hypothetical protein
MLCLKSGDFWLLLQTVDAAAPFNKEVKVLLDFVFHIPDDEIAHFP